MAILAAASVRARAVVAICPAAVEGLRKGIESGRLSFDADVASLQALLDSSDLQDAVGALTAPLLLLHAEGDEQVPVQHSRDLAEHFGVKDSRLIVLRGGHHRSIQHDAELQAVSLRFIERAFSET
jgi:pimeloyl-ACP methyl ester carboxylesterase